MFCTQCAKPLDSAARFCPSCGSAVDHRPATPRFVNQEGALDKLIPYKNAPALTGYYLGVFALIPGLGLVLGPAALVLGWRGLKRSRESPAYAGKTHAWVALVCGAITSVLNGLLAFFLAGVALLRQ